MVLSRTAPALPAPRTTPANVLPVGLAATVVGMQIMYPLAPQGVARDRLTVAIVLVFAATSLSHAAIWRGARFAAALCAITALGGLAVEAVGVSTGVPFGEYRYLDSLGVRLLGVPVVVALAWTMMAYPAYVVSEAVGGGLVRRTLVGGWALAAWDLFLDPQMVQAGHWQWEPTAGPALAGIPITNHVAWFVIACTMMWALHAVTLPRDAAVDDRVPLGLYGWTYTSSVLAHAVFFGLPASAVSGGIGMGVVVIALARALRRRQRASAGQPGLGRPDGHDADRPDTPMTARTRR